MIMELCVFLHQNKVAFEIIAKRPFSRKIYYPRTTTEKSSKLSQVRDK